jgi:lysyl-tRNA synthetase class 2
MPSTVIRRFDYRPEHRELLVIFTTGRRYVYSNVPPAAVDEFRDAFSKGQHFNAHIRDRYPYRELEPSEADRP